MIAPDSNASLALKRITSFDSFVRPFFPGLEYFVSQPLKF
ncbi:hypothetical protein YSA_00884 [Pseudomonas putida ND6]|uniref:Uncharacterized protein n=1 Tax=Pseudomonas putida ND6 TaxID=231023 RepID=I3UP33_PSEPU|nr:hypothetical protein YSA_00884 [Pseudomonas putida ND6]